MADGGSCGGVCSSARNVVLTRRQQFEVASSGFDDGINGFGGDPFGGLSSVGLRIPTSPNQPTRYLFLLATFTVGEGACVRIRGYRQLLTIGLQQTRSIGEEGAVARPIEMLVTSPFWHFTNGNVSWHMMRCGRPNASSVPQTPANGPVDLPSFKQYWSDGPALLYGPPAPAFPDGANYVNVLDYVPPNGGKPYGEALNNKFGTFYDLRTQWTTHGGWYSMDEPIEGPETVAFFASVLQTDPSARAAILVPGTFYQGGLSQEELFLLNFPTAVYYRIGGSLIVEEG